MFPEKRLICKYQKTSHLLLRYPAMQEPDFVLIVRRKRKIIGKCGEIFAIRIQLVENARSEVGA